MQECDNQPKLKQLNFKKYCKYTTLKHNMKNEDCAENDSTKRVIDEQMQEAKLSNNVGRCRNNSVSNDGID